MLCGARRISHVGKDWKTRAVSKGRGEQKGRQAGRQAGMAGRQADERQKDPTYMKRRQTWPSMGIPGRSRRDGPW